MRLEHFIFLYLLTGLAYSLYATLRITPDEFKIIEEHSKGDSFAANSALFFSIFIVVITWPYQLLKRI